MTEENATLQKVFMAIAYTQKKVRHIICISFAKSQKDVNAVKRCSIENQKGAIAIYFV